MAIKVNGTTVIGDSRQLQNVSSIDSTTANAISQLVPGSIVVDAPTITGSNVIPNSTDGGNRTITLTFSADSALLDGTVESFDINWADGSPVENANATAESATVSHVYPEDQANGTVIDITAVAIDDKDNRSATVSYPVTYRDNTPPAGTIVRDFTGAFNSGSVVCCYDVTFSGATDELPGTVDLYKVTDISCAGITVDSICKANGTPHTFCVDAELNCANPGSAFTICYNVSAIDDLGTEGPQCQMTHLQCFVPEGEASFTTPGSFSWTAPAGVTSVSVVAVGGGAHGAGNNNNPRSPDSGDSYFISDTCVAGLRGNSARGTPNDPNTCGGSFVGDGGGCGGCGFCGCSGPGGGGAGGYSGNGGNGGRGCPNPANQGCTNGGNGSGGAGGGGGGGSYEIHNYNAGGGVGIFGEGPSGSGGSRIPNGAMATGGSGGCPAETPPDETSRGIDDANGTGGFGGDFGGGGGASLSSSGGGGGGLGWKNNITVSPGGTYAVCVGNCGNNDDGGSQEGGHGGGGAVRIVWGGGVCFPDNAS